MSPKVHLEWAERELEERHGGKQVWFTPPGHQKNLVIQAIQSKVCF